MLGELLADRSRLARTVGDDVEHSRREAGLGEDLPQQAAGDRRPFGRLQHDGVAVGDRRRDRAQREDQRRVPRRECPGADGLLVPIAVPGVGRDHLASRLVAGARRLPEQAGREAHLEHAEAEGAAGLAREQLDDLVTAALEDVRRAQEESAWRAPGRSATGGERLRRGLDGAARVLRARPWRRWRRPRRCRSRFSKERRRWHRPTHRRCAAAARWLRWSRRPPLAFVMRTSMRHTDTIPLTRASSSGRLAATPGRDFAAGRHALMYTASEPGSFGMRTCGHMVKLRP